MKKPGQNTKTATIGVMGKKKSGKTTTIEILTKELSKRGYRVAVAKHIPEPNFTIDTEGKDTWRYAQSGAKTVIAASASEITTIEKTYANLSLPEIMQRCKGSDIVFLEGFRKLIARDKGTYKLVVAKSAQEIEEATEAYEPILAFTGPYFAREASLKSPYIDVLKHSDRLADLVEKVIKKRL